MTTAVETPQRRQIPVGFEHLIRRALVRFPAAAAAFVRAREGHPLDVHIVIDDQLAGTQACTREIQAHILGVTVDCEYWEYWRPQDGFGGYERIYLRHPSLASGNPASRQPEDILVRQAIREFLSRLECVEAVLTAPAGSVTHVWTVVQVLDQPSQDDIRAWQGQIVDCLESPHLTFHAIERGVMPLNRFLRSFMRANRAECVYRRTARQRVR